MLADSSDIDSPDRFVEYVFANYETDTRFIPPLTLRTVAAARPAATRIARPGTSKTCATENAGITPPHPRLINRRHMTDGSRTVARWHSNRPRRAGRRSSTAAPCRYRGTTANLSTMAVSSYDKLLRQLQGWRYAPYAALFHVDLHNVRGLNRTAGPKVADRVIADFGHRLAQWAGADSVSERLWSNEFVVAKPIDHSQTAMEEAIALRETLMTRQPNANDWAQAVSIGVTCCKPGGDWTQFLRQAALACEDAKYRGLNQIVVHSTAIEERRTQLVNVEYLEDFRQLQTAGALTLHPQPIFRIGGGETRLAKAEFLMRMEKNGVVMPLPRGMIESLERFGLAAELDGFAANYILTWLAENGAAMERLQSVSINLSAKSVADGNFMYRLFNDVRGARLPRGQLCFEITETTAVEHLDVASEAIEEFRSIGCGFSLDDFGSGLCSFGYLQSLAVDEVKIDGRFVRQIAHDTPSREIVSAIHRVAHATGKRTVAEFVDDRRKLEVLREIGVDYAQGYLFYPAIPSEKLLELLGLAATV